MTPPAISATEREAFFEAWLEGAGGAVPFEEWMDAALHHPRFGYYASRVRGIGRRGDFSTASTLHGALASAVAAWAAARRRTCFGRGGGKWHLIEIGPGSGDLSAGIRSALPARMRATLVLHLVETSPALREVQRETVRAARGLAGRFGLGGRIEWHGSPSEALDSARGRALVVSSELVDAFPAIVVRRSGSGWEELHLTRRDGAWREEWRPLRPERTAGITSSLLARGSEHPEGQRGEIHARYRAWLAGWAGHLREGAILTLDYGAPIDGLYHRRPGGTIRAFFHHQRLEGHDVYSRFGSQDVTADVNFTDLAAWGDELGLETAALEPQRDFMLRWRPEIEARARAEPALAYLLYPAGAGAAFLALEQRPARGTGR
jgi:SAM-dependent MidA family methyltransferase